MTPIGLRLHIPAEAGVPEGLTAQRPAQLHRVEWPGQMMWPLLGWGRSPCPPEGRTFGGARVINLAVPACLDFEVLPGSPLREEDP
jgi:hypothetical protein